MRIGQNIDDVFFSEPELDTVVAPSLNQLGRKNSADRLTHFGQSIDVTMQKPDGNFSSTIESISNLKVGDITGKKAKETGDRLIIRVKTGEKTEVCTSRFYVLKFRD